MGTRCVREHQDLRHGPPYLHPPVRASVWVLARVPLSNSGAAGQPGADALQSHGCPGLGVAESGMAESAPCPSIAGGFCGHAAGHTGALAPWEPWTRPPGAAHAGCRGREALVVQDLVQRFRLVAFLCGVIGRGGRGRGLEQPALPRSAGRSCCPGDMMIDRVSPPAGMRPLSLIRPSAWPLRPAAADRGLAGAGRGGPHRVSVAAAGPAGPAVTGWSPCPGERVVRRRRTRRRRVRPGCGRPAGGSCGPRTARRACRRSGP